MRTSSREGAELFTPARVYPVPGRVTRDMQCDKSASFPQSPVGASIALGADVAGRDQTLTGQGFRLSSPSCDGDSRWQCLSGPPVVGTSGLGQTTEVQFTDVARSGPLLLATSHWPCITTYSYQPHHRSTPAQPAPTLAGAGNQIPTLTCQLIFATHGLEHKSSGDCDPASYVVSDTVSASRTRVHVSGLELGLGSDELQVNFNGILV